MQKNEVIYYEFRRIDGTWRDITRPERASIGQVFSNLQMDIPEEYVSYCLMDNAVAFVKYRNCWSNLRVYVKLH